ncbi:MAG: hydrogenase iron-sulfur subunit [Thermoguttaceae bacterium]
MASTPCPDIIVYVCHRSIPQGKTLPRQWKKNGAHVLVHEVPCSGKMDGQYLMHAFEGGASGVCVVACPKGECHLGQGNYRAEIRLRTIQRLLAEIGLEAQRAELIRFSPDDYREQFDQLINDFVERIRVLGNSRIKIEKTLSSD